MHQEKQGREVRKGDWMVTMTPDDLYRNPMEIAWTFDYALGQDKVEDLYKRAKQNQWDSDVLLPWDTEVDPSNPLIADRSSLYPQMPFFKKLSKSQQETFIAHSTAQLLSQFLHGEQGALMTAACVTHSVPGHDRQALCGDPDHGRSAPCRSLFEILRQDRDGLSDVALAQGANRRDAEIRPL